MRSTVAVSRSVDPEVCNRVKEAIKCLGGIKSVMNNRALRMTAKRRLNEEVVASTVLYETETWNMRKANKRLECFK